MTEEEKRNAHAIANKKLREKKKNEMEDLQVEVAELEKELAVQSKLKTILSQKLDAGVSIMKSILNEIKKHEGEAESPESIAWRTSIVNKFREAHDTLVLSDDVIPRETLAQLRSGYSTVDRKLKEDELWKKLELRLLSESAGTTLLCRTLLMCAKSYKGGSAWCSSVPDGWTSFIDNIPSDFLFSNTSITLLSQKIYKGKTLRHVMSAIQKVRGIVFIIYFLKYNSPKFDPCIVEW